MCVVCRREITLPPLPPLATESLMASTLFSSSTAIHSQDFLALSTMSLASEQACLLCPRAILAFTITNHSITSGS